MNDNKDNKNFARKLKVEGSSVEQHMEENRQNAKGKISAKSIMTYAIMSIIVVVCLILLVHFCEKQVVELNKLKPTYKQSPTTSTSEVTIGQNVYVSTTRLQTAATHTVFDSGNRFTSTKPQPTRTHTVFPHTTVSSTTSSTTTTTTTTTSKVEEERPEKPEKPEGPEEPSENED